MRSSVPSPWPGLVLAVIAAGALACTWVPLTPEGNLVELLPAESTSSCEQIGQTRSRTTTRVGIFARSETRVREEQVALARNEAARMGANAVTPLGPPEGGERLFGVYRCPAR